MEHIDVQGSAYQTEKEKNNIFLEIQGFIESVRPDAIFSLPSLLPTSTIREVGVGDPNASHPLGGLGDTGTQHCFSGEQTGYSARLKYPQWVTRRNLLTVAGLISSYTRQPSPTDSVAVSDTIGTSFTVVRGPTVYQSFPFIAWGFAIASAPNTVIVNPSFYCNSFSWEIDEFSGVGEVRSSVPNLYNVEFDDSRQKMLGILATDPEQFTTLVVLMVPYEGSTDRPNFHVDYALTDTFTYPHGVAKPPAEIYPVIQEPPGT